MEAILEQIRATFDCGIWYPVVSSILTLPDACGAVEFWGQNKKPKYRYIEWYDKWVLPHYNPPNVKFDGSAVYIVRNAMIHESTGFTRGEHGFDRILFMPPLKNGLVIEGLLSSNPVQFKETAFQVTILGLLNAIELGVRNWLKEVRSDTDKRRETAIDKLIQYRPNGQEPHIVGFPIVS
jgi:hypothetical protein